MDDNEFLLFDRIEKIKSVIQEYGEDNFYLSFSGGKDSTILHHIIDMALPNNNIPRVFVDTGIEYKMIVDFVKNMGEHDNRIVVIKPLKNIKKMLEEDGYPFKSKEHSARVCSYQHGNKDGKWITDYLARNGRWGCPEKVRYTLTDEFKLNVSDKCCKRLKKDPLHEWQKENNKPYGILGIVKEEGGQRRSAKCLAFKGNKLKNFQPLVAVTKKWEDWFVEQYKIDICEIYKPPYNFDRTGCKGCPFNPLVQNALDILEQYFPAERKQCEYIWKPVYDEYRRIGYRLSKNDKI